MLVELEVLGAVVKRRWTTERRDDGGGHGRPIFCVWVWGAFAGGTFPPSMLKDLAGRLKAATTWNATSTWSAFTHPPATWSIVWEFLLLLLLVLLLTSLDQHFPQEISRDDNL